MPEIKDMNELTDVQFINHIFPRIKDYLETEELNHLLDMVKWAKYNYDEQLDSIDRLIEDGAIQPCNTNNHPPNCTLNANIQMTYAAYMIRDIKRLLKKDVASEYFKANVIDIIKNTYGIENMSVADKKAVGIIEHN